MSAKILIVDDQIENIRILEKILAPQYEALSFDDGFNALEYLFNTEKYPDLILLDIMMPKIDGHQMLMILKSHNELKKIPVICVTASTNEAKALSLGADDFISKPFEPPVVHMRVEKQILIQEYLSNLEALVDDKVEEVIKTQDNLLFVLADIIEYRDIESGGHVRRVANYTEALLDALIKSHHAYSHEIKNIGKDIIVKAVPTHDIGKIGIPDRILLKAGKLTDKEFEEMKTHTIIGKKILDSILRTSKENSDFLMHCGEIALHHHEKYDGTGYPMQLAGENIPLSARIVAVVDVYDALVTERVYKDAISHEDAMSIMKKDSGSHFDPELIEAMINIENDFKYISKHITPGIHF